MYLPLKDIAGLQSGDRILNFVYIYLSKYARKFQRLMYRENNKDFSVVIVLTFDSVDKIIDYDYSNGSN